MRPSILLSVTTLCSCISGVFVDDAYRIDFHKALLGLPEARSTFFQQPYAESKASLLYTISEKNVLGAVNPKDGTLVWRHRLSLNETSSGCMLRAGGRGDTIFSGCQDKLIAWSSGDGRIVWDHQFPHERVRDFHILEAAQSQGHGAGGDAVVLLAGQSSGVQRLHRETGAVKWTYNDNSGDQLVTVSASADKLYIVSLHSALLKGQKIAVTTLDPTTGKKLDHYQLGSEGEVSGLDDILATQTLGPLPVLIWTDQSKTVLKVNVLGKKQVSSSEIKASGPNIEYIAIHGSTNREASPHFLVQYGTAGEHWAEVFHFDEAKLKLSKAYDLPRRRGHGAFSASSTGASVFFTRITEDEVSLTSSASHGILERWQLTDFDVPGLLDKTYPVHANSEVIARAGPKYAVRCSVLLSSGDWVLVRNGESSWSRPEALAGIVSAEWAELRLRDSAAADLEDESGTDVLSTFLHRANRHVLALQTLPSWFSTLPAKLSRWVLSFGKDEAFKNMPIGDANAFKLVVATTENGRIIGLDFGHSGRVLFNTRAETLGIGDGTTGARQSTHAQSSTLVAQARAKGSYRQWLQELGISNAEFNLELFSRGPHGVPLQSTGATKTSYSLRDGNLVGFRSGIETWKFTPPAGERIAAVSSILEDEPVASIGKVLGDRQVLYKYLNPNAMVVVLVNDSKRMAFVYALDAVSGDILHSSDFERVDTSRHLAAAISENWFAVSFTTDPLDDGSSKGFQLVMSEMYESDLPNDRGILGASANYSSIKPKTKLTKPYVVSKTFHVPEEVQKMAVTQTRQGITSRQLLVSLPNLNSLVGIPGYLLDARRTIDKDPTSAQVQEGLSRYQPFIDIEPTWVLNHKQEVIGTKNIMTTPGLFESTGLVFAYGLDVFGTQVTPSFAFDILGSSFNKVQLMLTVVALLAGVFVVAPFIQRKETNLLWQNS